MEPPPEMNHIHQNKCSIRPCSNREKTKTSTEHYEPLKTEKIQHISKFN